MLDRPGDVAALATPAVLVVNDYEGQRAAIRSMLEPLGVAIVEADSGRAALRAVFDQMFAVILMDVRMPHMDGYETADLIRVHPRSTRTPIIFVTAHASDDIETVSAYTLGAVDFLFTPLVPDVLRAKVAVFVDLFEQSERLRYSLDSITTLNAALHDSQARSQAVLDNVADGIVTIYEGGLIESFNPAAPRRLEQSPHRRFTHVELHREPRSRTAGLTKSVSIAQRSSRDSMHTPNCERTRAATAIAALQGATQGSRRQLSTTKASSAIDVEPLGTLISMVCDPAASEPLT
jgi:CheY-like chemotaxis protein